MTTSSTVAKKITMKSQTSKSKQPQLQPGDPEYKTPTQLRNARKRRKTKNKKNQKTSTLISSSGSDNFPSFNNSSSNSSSRSSADPSLKYLSNPKAAPTVRNAIKFFRDKISYHNNAETFTTFGSNHDTYFPIIIGPKLGWRTVARLAIQRRRKKKGSSSSSSKKPKSKTRIGLFVPGSHELLSVPDCPVHHRKVNEVIKIVEEECNSLNVPVFDNDDNDDDATTDDTTTDTNMNDNSIDATATKFGLRYVAVAVERSTQKQQLVLVWKEPPSPSSNNEQEEDNNKSNNNKNCKKNKPLINLIKRLIKLSTTTTATTAKTTTKKINDNQNQLIDQGIVPIIQLHSIWIHYNNTWKHANSIFDRNGRWETKYVHDDYDNGNIAVSVPSPASVAITTTTGGGGENKIKTATTDDDDPLNGSIQEVMLPIKTTATSSSSGYGGSSSSSSKLRVPLFFPPQVFRQANLDGFAKIIVSIRNWLQEQLLLQVSKSSLTSTKNEEQISNDSSSSNKRKRRRGQRDTSNHSDHHDNRTTATTTATLGHCLELYGGVGTIGLNLIDLFDSIESSDENPFNEKCFNAAADQITTTAASSSSSSSSRIMRMIPINELKRKRITYISKSASDVVINNYSSLQKARVVIVDPPRKGLDETVIEALCKDYNYNTDVGEGEQQQQQALIYVSCGFDAFRRDYEALVEKSGKWTLDRAEGK